MLWVQMKFGLVGSVELRIKAGLVRFRIGWGSRVRVVRLGWRVG